MAETSPHETMQCMEVWGGNQLVDTTVELPGLNAWVYSRPYQNAKRGGDLHYVSSCATGRITRLLVADVSGHGDHVGHIATTLRGLMSQYINYFSQNRFIQAMNAEFTRLSESGLFATAVVTSFFASTRELSICNAGHPPPLIYRQKDKKWSCLETRDSKPLQQPATPSNIPLGLINETAYDQLDIQLEIGDLVVCYTDSLIESDDSQGRMLGTKGLLGLIQTLDVSEPSRLIPTLLQTISSQSPGNLTNDDVTVLLFRPNGQAAHMSLMRRLLAPVWLIKGLLVSLFSGSRQLPWPEMTLRNMGLDFFTRKHESR